MIIVPVWLSPAPDMVQDSTYENHPREWQFPQVAELRYSSWTCDRLAWLRQCQGKSQGSLT